MMNGRGANAEFTTGDCSEPIPSSEIWIYQSHTFAENKTSNGNRSRFAGILNGSTFIIVVMYSGDVKNL